MILINKQWIDEAQRQQRLAQVAARAFPDFTAETAAVRAGNWSVTVAEGSEPSDKTIIAGLQGCREARAAADQLRQSRGDDAGKALLWIDSIWGAFELEEMLYELRDCVAEARCDYDAYLFSFITTFQDYAEFVLPDRADMGPNCHFLHSLTRLVESVCLRRGVAVAEVAETGLARGDSAVEAADLLLVPRGRITQRGIRQNLRTALVYLSDRADADLSDEERLRRASAASLAVAQLWQWVRHETGVLDEGRIVTAELVLTLLDEEAASLAVQRDPGDSIEFLSDNVLAESFTMPAFCGRLASA